MSEPVEEILCHYSAAPLKDRIISRAQKTRADMKPSGFWVSVDNVYEEGWACWCRAENFGVDRLAVKTRVFLHGDARILRLTTVAELDAFSVKYRGNPYPEYPGRDFASVGYIDWAAVAREHQGIIIAPYQWERRLATGFTWYYGWDCASGCIWDVRAIADLVEVKS